VVCQLAVVIIGAYLIATEVQLAAPSIWLVEDALKQWQTEHSRLLGISHITGTYLACQGTSVASERMWSSAVYIVSNRRNSNRMNPLKSAKLLQLMFLSNNFE